MKLSINLKLLNLQKSWFALCAIIDAMLDFEFEA